MVYIDLVMCIVVFGLLRVSEFYKVLFRERIGFDFIRGLYSLYLGGICYFF